MIPAKAKRWEEVTRPFGGDTDLVKKALDRIDREEPKHKRSTQVFRLLYGLTGEKAKSIIRVSTQLKENPNTIERLRNHAEELLQNPRWRTDQTC